MHTHRHFILSLLAFVLMAPSAFSQTEILRVGSPDGKYSEFNTLGGNYSRYREFYPEATAFYLEGKNDEKAIPYVLPGPSDRWAGSPKGALMLCFGLSSFDLSSDLTLSIDFVETHSEYPPRLAVTLNGVNRTLDTPRGYNQGYLNDGKTASRGLSVSLTLPADCLKKGDNMLTITNVSGSWVVLDALRLTAAGAVRKTTVKGDRILSVLSARAKPALVYGKDRQELLIPVQVSVMNGSKRTRTLPWTCAGARGELKVEPGVHTLELGLPEALENKTETLCFTNGNATQTLPIDLPEVLRWEVFMVQHTHTDIGYTKPQTEILAEHLRYIDYAVDYCDATADYPDDAKFRWTCEASWAVSEWLRIRPKEQVERFIQYVKNGQIEVTAMYFNMSELSGENSYRHFLEPIRTFRELGISPVTAMQDDVNGIAWCLADYLPGLGVKYMTMGSNGHRALIPFDRPTLYWWESPSGSRLLSWRSDHYMTGNFIGLAPGNLTTLEAGLLPYIEGLKDQGYPFPLVSVQYSGYYTDNSPPSYQRCDVIREWNERYAWPKVRSATISEFLSVIEKRYGDALPVYRAAYPDWWTDGFGSAARETAASRTTQADMTAITSILAMARMKGLKDQEDTFPEIARIYQDLLFYDEHTFGAAESISNPQCDNSQVQWAEKASYAWDGLKNAQMLAENATGKLQPHLFRGTVPTLSLINPTGEVYSGPVEVYIDFELIPDGAAFQLAGADGKRLYAQRTRTRSEGAYYVIWADRIPPMGYETFRILLQGDDNALPAPGTEETERFENEWYSLRIDTVRGGVASLCDKQLGLELVDADKEWPLGDLVYESLEGDRHQMERKVFERYHRSGLRDLHIVHVTEGKVFKSIYMEGKADGCEEDFGVRFEIRMFKPGKLLSFAYAVKRIGETDPSALYVALPFSLKEGRVVFDVPGGQVTPVSGQLPRSSSAWNTVQNYVSVRNDEAQILVSCPKLPLYLIGGLMDRPYETPAVDRGTGLYSWVMNNYWTTNFKAAQDGEFGWNYYLTSLEGHSNADAAAFGQACRVPVFAHVVPAARADNGKALKGSLLSTGKHNLMIFSLSVIPDGSGDLLVGVRETDGEETELQLFGEDGKALSFSACDVLGEGGDDLFRFDSLGMMPFAIQFVRVTF